MRIVGPIFVAIGYVLLVSFYWKRVAEENAAFDRRWYLTWIAKGLAFPIFVWFLLNIGHTPVMPALIKVIPRRNIAPPILVAPANPAANTPAIIVPRPPKYVGVGPVGYVAIQTAPAFGAVSSYWGALTLGWFTVALARRAEKRRGFIIGSLIWGLVMLPFMALLFWFNGLGILGVALSLWFAPVLHYAVSLEVEPEPLPRYTSAIVKIKFGKYAEAEQAIIKELEKCENDFDGWLMLAELYARQFDDIGEAERTVLELCNDSATTLSQKSVALHKLADWHLQFHDDPLAARRAMEEIVKRMPGTHLARMAQLRLRQIPTTTHEWLEQHNRGKKVKMPALNDALENPADENLSDADPRDAERSANLCVDKLRRDPNDTTAREQLARIFAERLGQAAQGIAQLDLLLGVAGQPPEKMAQWLSLIAAWQIKYLNDKDAAQKTLQRLVREFPQSVQAFAAQRRLKLMEMETR